MIITPSANGWSYDDSIGKWKLAYEDKTIIFYEKTDESIATPTTLFVGTQDQCEEEIIRVELNVGQNSDNDLNNT
jgi:hypothetical protein